LNLDVLHDYQPPETQILLLIAALAEPESAAGAWHKWTQRRDVETATWPEVRLLAAVAQRMATLDPSSKLLPRLQGIRRFVWTQTQMCLSKALPLLSALCQARLRFILLKGAARIAVDPSSSADRLIRDVDVLIHPDDWTAAVDAAIRERWQIEMDQDNPAIARSKSFAEHHAINFKNADAQIDMHRYALYVCRNNGDDDGLWSRTVSLQWRGIPVNIPCPTDELLIALNHGFSYAPEPTADWALDAAALIRSGKIDWDLLLEQTSRREVDVSVAAGLTLLTERIGVDVSPDVLASLRRRVREPFIGEFIGNVTAYKPGRSDLVRAVLAAAGIRAQKAMESANEKPVQANGLGKILKTDPIALPRDRAEKVVQIPESLPARGKLRIEFDFTLWPFAFGRQMILEIRAPGMLLKRASYPIRRRLKLVPVRRRIALQIPAALFLARNINHITVRLLRPRFATPMPVRTCVLRWKLCDAPSRTQKIFAESKFPNTPVITSNF